MHPHPSRLNDYTFPSSHQSGNAQAAVGGPAQPPSSAAAHQQQHNSGYAVASGSRPAYIRRRSVQSIQTHYSHQQQTPSGLVAAAHASATTPRSATFPQPIFDPDSPFSQPPQGRTTVSPEKQRHPSRSVVRTPEPDESNRPYWGEDALGTPHAIRSAPKARLEDVAESFAHKEAVDSSVGYLPEESYVDHGVFDGGHQPIAAIRRERGRGRAVVLDVPQSPPPAPAMHDEQVYIQHSHQPVHHHHYHHQPEPAAAYAPVAGPSSARVYPQHQPPFHHRGQSDDLHNRQPNRPVPTTPASYYVPMLQTTALAPTSPGALGGRHYQPPRVISPLPGGGDWGQFVHAELFEEGNSQEEIAPFGAAAVGGGDGTSAAEHEHAPPLPHQPHVRQRTVSAHAFHHPRPRPVMSAHDIEPTPVLEPHSDTSPTFSLSSRSQPGTPASFGVPDYAEHHQTQHLSAAGSSSYASSSSGSGSMSQFQFASAQPYNPETLDSFNPAQMHLPPSSFTFTSAAPPPPTTRVPDYRSHRRIKSVESVMSDYGPLAGQPDHETIPEEYDDSFGPSDAHGSHSGGRDDYALNDLVKQVHLQHGGQSLYRARTESASRPSTASRGPSPMDHYQAHPTEQQLSPYAEHRPYPQPPAPYAQVLYPPHHHSIGTPVILVPHGQPPPPGMVPIHTTAYAASDPSGHPNPASVYLQPHSSLSIAPSPSYQATFNSGSTSPYSVHSPVMGRASEAGSSHYALSPVVDGAPPPQPVAPAAPSKETLAARRRSNRRGGSLSMSSTKNGGEIQPMSFSASDLSASTASTLKQEPAVDTVHFHPYSRPSSSQPASSSAAPSSNTSKTTASSRARKRRSAAGATPKRRPTSSTAGSALLSAVDKSAMAALIETLYEPLDADNVGSESASPPPALDYDTATGGKGKGKEELKFRCLVEDCDRAFPRRSAIIHHIQMHLSDKPFVCPVPDWYVARSDSFC